MQDEVKGPVAADGNLLARPAASPDGETTEALIERPGTRIERIVSSGQGSPPGFWYDQEEDEWVALLSGAARIQFDDGTSLGLAPGDHVLIPAHRRHRVGWTHPALPTVWLAVFLKPER